jgi:integrase
MIRSASGPVRAMAWRLGCEAGLRIGEIVSLRVRDVELDAEGGPVITVRASVSKNRTEARLPLHPGLARDLVSQVLGRLPLATVLGLPTSFVHRATYWLKRDLTAAGIPYADAAGRKADVHSLRSSFITSLVRSGANVKAVQRLARHSSPVETVGIYTRLTPEDERDALRALISVVRNEDSPNERRATGTDGPRVLGSC